MRALRNAKVMVLVFTAHVNSSHEVKKELALASHYDIPVIPVRIEAVEEADAFAYELATRQWIDMFPDWDRAMERLSAHIAAVAGGEPAAIGAPSPIAAIAPSQAPAQGSAAGARCSPWP